jgi:hypothetical protein
MDKEFHYYITYIIAQRAGFQPRDAYVIAYASQHTDDNTTDLTISPDSPDAYSNYISQTMDIFKPQGEHMRIYPAFHFMPGTIAEISSKSAMRRDGNFHILNTVPDNQNSRKVLKAALDSNDLYRIGIATHMYADTFAHQNYVGYKEDFNQMKGLWGAVAPSIGHADAMHKPDRPALKWDDERLIPSHSSIDNKKRFLDASQSILGAYSAYLGTHPDEQAIIRSIDLAIGDYDPKNASEKERIKHYKELIGPNFVEYSKNAWFQEAVAGNVKDGYTWQEDYQQSNWFRFQEAVKAHQRYAMGEVLQPIFNMMEFHDTL